MSVMLSSNLDNWVCVDGSRLRAFELLKNRDVWRKSGAAENHVGFFCLAME